MDKEKKPKPKSKKKATSKGKEEKKELPKIGPGKRPVTLDKARTEEVVRLGGFLESATQRVTECQAEVDRAKEALASKRGIFVDAQKDLTDICTEISSVYSGEFQPPLPGLKKPAAAKKRKGKK